MATIGHFQVHTDTDKENEVAGFRPIEKSFKNRSLQAFPNKGGNKFSNPTPRRALGSVNQQLPTPQPQSIKGKGHDLSQPPVQALFNKSKGFSDENSLSNLFSKKAKKKSPSLHTSSKRPSQKLATKPKTVKLNTPPTFDPIPNIPEDLDDDPNAILPQHDRLSCYVDKLLNWRPPCLFGTLPDSDSDIGDFDEELNFDDGLDLGQIRDSLYKDHEEDDVAQDLSLLDIPPLSPLSFPSPSQTTVALDSLMDFSPNTSLKLGQLYFGTPEKADSSM